MRAATALSLVAGLAGCGRLNFAERSVEPGDAADAAGDGGGLSCLATDRCPGFATFCEDFETTTEPDFAPWDDVQLVNYSGGSIDPLSANALTDNAACGAKAFETRINGSTQWGQIFKTLTPRANPTFLRVMTYVPSTNASFDIDTLGVGDLVAQYILVNVHVDNRISIHASQPITGPASVDPVIVRDRWQCIEMAVTFGDSAGHVTIWVDDVMVIDAAGGTEVGGNLDQAILGVSTGSQTGLTAVDFDDFVLAAERIGCS